MIYNTESEPANQFEHTRRQIRSFVRRQGRLTKGQQYALQHYWSKMGVDYQPGQVLNWQQLFGRQAETVLEIGFGMGKSLVQMAKESPQRNFLGIEVHLPGVGACLASAHAAGLTNLRIICHDALEVLTSIIKESSLDCIQLFFPDPWPKTRHHKRRIVQTAFVELICSKLKTGGIFHLATDWENYAEQMLKVIQQIAGFSNLAADKRFIPRPESRPITKFEQRGQQLGHGVWDLMFVRTS